MRNFVIAGLVASTFCLFTSEVTFALPAAMPSASSAQVDGSSDLQDTRLYCYNRYTGRFLHWGPCGGYGGGYRRPRVYCYNRYSGRFLHWGACY